MREEMLNEIIEQTCSDSFSPTIRELRSLIGALFEYNQLSNDLKESIRELNLFLEIQPFLKIDDAMMQKFQDAMTFEDYCVQFQEYVKKEIINKLGEFFILFNNLKFEKNEPENLRKQIRDKINSLVNIYVHFFHSDRNRSYETLFRNLWNQGEFHQPILPFVKIVGIDIGERLIPFATACEWLGVENDNVIGKNNSDGQNCVRFFKGNCYKRTPDSSYNNDTQLPELQFNPAMETYVNSMYQLLDENNAAPTTVIKLTFPENIALHEKGERIRRNYILQVSRRISAADLSPDDIDNISFNNYSSLSIASLMMRPNDGKWLNIIVQLINSAHLLTYIDNDESGFPMQFIQAQGCHLVGLKDILFLLRQVENPYSEEFIHAILGEKDLVRIYFTWLNKLIDIDDQYKSCIEKGIFTTREFQYRGLGLQFKFANDELKRVLDIVIEICKVLSTQTNISPLGLFSRIYPIEAEVCARLRHEIYLNNNNVIRAYNILHNQTIEHILRQISEEIARQIKEKGTAVKIFEYLKDEVKNSLTDELKKLIDDKHLIIRVLENCQKSSLFYILETLCRIGYSFRVDTEEDKKIICLVAARGNAECINLLYQHGANFNFITNTGQTLFDIAIMHDNHSCKNELINLMSGNPRIQRQFKIQIRDYLQAERIRLIINLFNSQNNIQIGLDIDSIDEFTTISANEIPENYYLHKLIQSNNPPGWIINFTSKLYQRNSTYNRLASYGSDFFNDERRMKIEYVGRQYKDSNPETWLEEYSIDSSSFIIIENSSGYYDIAICIEDIYSKNISEEDLERLIKRIVILSLHKPVCIQSNFLPNEQTTLIALKVTLIARIVSDWLKKSLTLFKDENETYQNSVTILQEYLTLLPFPAVDKWIRNEIDGNFNTLFNQAKRIYFKCIDKIILLDFQEQLEKKEKKDLLNYINGVIENINNYIATEEKQFGRPQKTNIKIKTLGDIKNGLEKATSPDRMLQSTIIKSDICKLYLFMLAVRSCNWLYLPRLDDTRLAVSKIRIGPKCVRNTFFPLLPFLLKLFTNWNRVIKQQLWNGVIRKQLDEQFKTRLEEQFKTRGIISEEMQIGLNEKLKSKIEKPEIPEKLKYNDRNLFFSKYLKNRRKFESKGYSLYSVIYHNSKKGNILMLGSIPVIKRTRNGRNIIIENEEVLIRNMLNNENSKTELKLIISVVEFFEIKGKGFDDAKLNNDAIFNNEEYEIIKSETWQNQGIKHIIVPFQDEVNDIKNLSEEQLQLFMNALHQLYDFLNDNANAGVLVHCKSGKGRSFSLVATFLILFHMDPKLSIRERTYHAIKLIRNRRPQADEYEKKYEFIEDLVLGAMIYFNFALPFSNRNMTCIGRPSSPPGSPSALQQRTDTREILDDLISPQSNNPQQPVTQPNNFEHGQNFGESLSMIGFMPQPKTIPNEKGKQYQAKKGLI